ncbi:hypothetical protein ABEB36_009564 [Hypothenemus hampei]|uniref:Uncharacterized protein n=1 Tax=Hypothenemus hampei TaxID=57062 RepID=A0ABD1EGR3_HYPHA
MEYVMLAQKLNLLFRLLHWSVPDYLLSRLIPRVSEVVSLRKPNNYVAPRYKTAKCENCFDFWTVHCLNKCFDVISQYKNIYTFEAASKCILFDEERAPTR